jgi:DNA-binding FadR family transcriptional regulator
LKTGVDVSASLREAITEKLQSRRWRPGHRIPTEREFSAQFGLGRAAVRRVLQEFKRHGWITQVVGSGTYVSETPPPALRTPGHLGTGADALSASPAELIGARLVFEPALIEMVTAHATAADFARMDECNAQAERARTLDAFEHWDGQLHEAIANAAHNGFLSSVFRLMNLVRAQGEWGALKRRSATPARRLEYEQEHRALVAALRDRDAVRARALCTAHLLHVRANMLGF